MKKTSVLIAFDVYVDDTEMICMNTCHHLSLFNFCNLFKVALEELTCSRKKRCKECIEAEEDYKTCSEAFDIT